MPPGNEGETYGERNLGPKPEQRGVVALQTFDRSFKKRISIRAFERPIRENRRVTTVVQLKEVSFRSTLRRRKIGATGDGSGCRLTSKKMNSNITFERSGGQTTLFKGKLPCPKFPGCKNCREQKNNDWGGLVRGCLGDEEEVWFQKKKGFSVRRRRYFCSFVCSSRSGRNRIVK